MANLKELRDRINSVQSTKKITSAMKLVAGARLKKAQTEAESSRSYVNKMQTIIDNVTSNINIDSAPEIIRGKENDKTHLIVLMTSDRGLCGAFNNNNIKIAKSIVSANDEKGVNTFVLPLGKKAVEAFPKSNGTMPEGFEPIAIFGDLNFNASSEVADFIMDGYLQGNWDIVEIAYSKFKNAAVQIPTQEAFLPLLPNEGEDDATASQVDYIFEPNKEEIIENILPSALKTQLYKALLDSHASEHGARMTAMHSATENAGELLNELKISYNKARQAAITTEILEIVAGSEALEG